MLQMLIQVTRHLSKPTAVPMTLFPQLAVSLVVFTASPFHNFPSFFPFVRATADLCLSPLQPEVSSDVLLSPLAVGFYPCCSAVLGQRQGAGLPVLMAKVHLPTFLQTV